MNCLQRYLFKRRTKQLEQQRENQEVLRRAQHLADLGVCPDCYGKGAYDDPPWGVIRCRSCGGTGKRY